MSESTNETSPQGGVIVIESHDENGTEWGISFNGHNPEAGDYFKMVDAETAFRLKKKLGGNTQLKPPFERIDTTFAAEKGGCDKPPLLNSESTIIHDQGGQTPAPLAVPDTDTIVYIENGGSPCGLVAVAGLTALTIGLAALQLWGNWKPF